MIRLDSFILCLAVVAALGFSPIAEAHYSPTQGRWVERDPIGYADGASLYQYAGGRASSALDPQGKQHEPPGILPIDPPPGMLPAIPGAPWPEMPPPPGTIPGPSPHRPSQPPDCEPPKDQYTSPENLEECLKRTVRQTSKGSCGIYQPHWCLHETNVQCMCVCMGSSPGESFVRGCLQCMLRKRIDWKTAHTTCLTRSNDYFPGDPAPGVLGYCVNHCREWQRKKFPNQCEWPPPCYGCDE